MRFTETALKGSFIVEPDPVVDSRGWFSRYFCKKEFAQIHHDEEWVQMNHSLTRTVGAVRGLHYQVPPFSETKLVRCVAGTVFDVIVDIREKSPSFLQWFGLEISAANRRMMYVPKGFAHGFQTLTDNCEMLYHHTSYYSPEAEGGLRFDDKAINVKWQLPVKDVSDRDLAHNMITKEFTGIKL